MKSVTDVDKIVRDMISKRDPHGYYVIIAINDIKTKQIVEEIIKRNSPLIEIEGVGNILVIRGKSRRIMEKLIRLLILRNLVVI